MKLYLSSFRLGDHPERLVALLPPNGRVAVICNSIDAEDPAVRREKVADEITWLTELGPAAPRNSTSAQHVRPPGASSRSTTVSGSAAATSSCLRARHGTLAAPTRSSRT